MSTRSARWLATLAAVAGLLLTALAGPPVWAAAGTAQVGGVLSIDGVPQSGARIELVRWSGGAWSFGIPSGGDDDGWTDEDGEFRFTDLAPGTYTFTVHQHFPNGSTTPPVGPGAPGAFDIADGQQLVRDFALPLPPRTVTGRVLTLEGDPAAGAWVWLKSLADPSGPWELYSTVAGADGTYSLPLYDDEIPHTVSAALPTYLMTYLGGSTRYWEATAFGFDGPTALADLVLESQHVGGRVLSAAGAGVPGVPVTLLRWHYVDKVWVDHATATTDGEGRYLFRNTGEGHFSVVVDDSRGTVFPDTGLVPPTNPMGGDWYDTPGVRYLSNGTGRRDVDLALPPAPPGLVTVRGVPVVGETLRAVAGWGAGYALGYQWLRDGRAIAGATAATYRPVGTDGRRTISVRVTATTGYPGLAGAEVASAGSRIRGRSALRLVVRPQRAAARISVRLVLPGTRTKAVAGRVRIMVDGKRRAVVKVRKGRATLVLRRLGSGRHTFAAEYSGTSEYAGATVLKRARVRG